MNKRMSHLITSVFSAAMLTAATMFVFNFVSRDKKLDGDDMVYRWTNYQLCGNWVEIDPYEGKPSKLAISPIEIKFENSNGSTGKFTYKLPEGTQTEGSPEAPVYLEMTGGDFYDDLVFHEEYVDGNSEAIPIISATAFEYDGRGEIVLIEFARAEDLEMLPEGYESTFCKERNDREPIPTMMMLETTNRKDVADRLCGIYSYKGEDETEDRTFTIRMIDDRFYLDYGGVYDYAAAELQFESPESYASGDDLAYNVRIYPFSGFSFAGEYWGAGTESHILLVDDTTVLLEAGQPFLNGETLELTLVEKAEDGGSLPLANGDLWTDLFGAWHAPATVDGHEGELFLEVGEDGTIELVRKVEGFPAEVYCGTYEPDSENGKRCIRVLATRLGYGGEPHEWNIAIADGSSYPVICDRANADELLFTDGEGNAPHFESSVSGEHVYEIAPGPGSRLDEVVEAWEAFIGVED